MIFVAGSANLDFVVRSAHIPVPGETVLGRDFQTFPGGKGANQALACARAGGVETAMLLALGDDAFAAPIEASLKSAGVHMHVARIADAPTGTAFICVADDARNAITVAPGANHHLLETHLPPLMGVSHLLMQLEIPLATVATYASRARVEGIKVVLNAAPAQSLSPQLLAMVDVLVVNEGELAGIVGSVGDVGSIAQSLLALDVDCVVVTLGERGCVARAGSHFFTQPAYIVDAVDTTAAGDTFCGMLTASLANNLSLPDALIEASAAAALACTRMGAQSSIPAHREVAAFLRAQPSADDALHARLRRYCGIPA